MSTVILQARSSSKRFKNKVLAQINGKPMIYYVYKRILKSEKVKKIIIACSNHRSDDQLFWYCKSKGYLVERGSLNNLVQRFNKVIKKYKLKYFIRISGDSPCMDFNVINKVYKVFRKNNCDIATNVYPRSFPKGISVEVIKTKIFKKLLTKRLSLHNKEHVTSYFYENAKDYKIYNLKNSINRSRKSLALDTKNDFKKLKPIIKQKDFFNLNWQNILNKKNRLWK